MKKITFILFAIISGTVFAQDSSEATADVNAQIVSPISVTSVSGLDFGRVIGNAAGGTVTIAHADGERTASNDDLLDNTNSGNAGAFSVTAADTYAYSISIPDITLTGGGDAMPVTFTNNLGESSTGTGDAQDLNLGGTLTVNANQAEGAYEGEVKVTVAYE